MNVILFVLLATSLWAKTCAHDIKTFQKLFGDEAYPLHWEETTADDGKPLIVKITETKGTLFLEFMKTKEGLWASGSADICGDNDEISAAISKEQIKLGKAAHWAIKMSMKNGAKFTLTKLKPLVLKISTFGWSGEFVPGK